MRGFIRLIVEMFLLKWIAQDLDQDDIRLVFMLRGLLALISIAVAVFIAVITAGKLFNRVFNLIAMVDPFHKPEILSISVVKNELSFLEDLNHDKNCFFTEYVVSL